MAIITVTFRTSPENIATRLRVPERITDEIGEEITGKDRERWIIERAVEKNGQVMQALRPTKRNSNPGNASVTSRIRVDVGNA